MKTFNKYNWMTLLTLKPKINYKDNEETKDVKR